MPVEGSLDIMWMNRGTAATPQYSLFFLPYANPRGGAQNLMSWSETWHSRNI